MWISTKATYLATKGKYRVKFDDNTTANVYFGYTTYVNKNTFLFRKFHPERINNDPSEDNSDWWNPLLTNITHWWHDE